MTYTPNFEAYHVATVRDGGFNPEETGDLTIRQDNRTYIYRGIEPRWHAAFFDWASAKFAPGESGPQRLAGSAEYGWSVEGGFTPPEPIPADDSDEYQAWLDGPFAAALDAWETEYRPAQVAA